MVDQDLDYYEWQQDRYLSHPEPEEAVESLDGDIGEKESEPVDTRRDELISSASGGQGDGAV